MSRQERKFTFTTTITWGNKNPQRIELEISGIGYYYAGSEPGEEYMFDIETVKADGQDFTNIYKLLESDNDSRLDTTINEATMAHMGYLFSTECDMCTRELSAVSRVENGDFTNVFEAIAEITQGYNNTILVTPVTKNKKAS